MPDYDFTLRATNVEELRAQLRALRAEGMQTFTDVGASASQGLARLDSAQRDSTAAAGQTAQAYDALAQRVTAIEAASGRAVPALATTGQALGNVEIQAGRSGAALMAYTTTMTSLDHTVSTVAVSLEGAISSVADVAGVAIKTTGDLAQTVAIAIGATVGAFQVEGIIHSLAELKAVATGDSEALRQLGKDADEGGRSLAGMVAHWATYRAAAAGASAVGLDGLAVVVGLLGRVNLYLAGFVYAAEVLSAAAKATDALTATQQGLQKELERTHYASGMTAAGILDLAWAEEDHGARSQQAIAAGAQALLAYDGVSGPVFQRAVGYLDDLSVKFGTTLPNSAKLLGAALQDPKGGLTGLADAGVLFTRETRLAIAAAVDLGDQIKAQGLVLDAVAASTGDAASGLSDATHAANRLDSAVTHLLETVGPFVVRMREIKDSVVALFTEPSTWLENKTADVINFIADHIDLGPLDERITATGRKIADLKTQIAAGEASNTLLDRVRAPRLKADLEESQSEYRKLIDLARRAETEEQRAADGAARIASERRSSALASLSGTVDQGFGGITPTTEQRVKAVNAEMDKLIDKLDALRAPDGSNAAAVDAEILKVEQLRESKLRDVAASTAQTEATDAGTTARGNARNAMEDLLDRIVRERDALSETERERTINNAALEAERVARGKLTGGALAEYIRQVEYEAAVTYDAKKARDAKTESDRQASQASEAYARDVARVSENIGKDVASNLWDQITGEAKAGDAHRFIVNWVKRLGVELLAQKLILPITMQVVGAVPSLFGISGGDGATGAGGTASAQGGTGTTGIGNQLSSLSNLTTGSQSLYNTGSWLATSQLGQSLGLSSTMTATNVAEAGVMGVQGGMQAGTVSMSGLGSSFAQGLSYSPWGAVGSIGASMMGLGKGADPYAKMGLSTLGSIGGGMAGAAAGSAIGGTMMGMEMGSVLGPLGAIAGAIIGTALSSLIPADKQIPWGQYSAYQGQTRGVEGLDDFDTAPMKKAGDTAVGVLQSLASAIGVSATSLPLGGFGYSQEKRGNLNGGWYSFVGGGGFESNSAQNAASADEAVANFMARSLRSADLSSVGEAVKTAIANTTAKTTSDLLADLNVAKSIDDATSGLTDLDKSLAGLEAAAKKSAATQYEGTKTEYERAKALGLGDQYADILIKQLKSAYGTSADATATLGPLSQSLAALDGQFAALSDAVHAMGLSLTDAELAAMKAAQAEKLLKSYRDQWDTAYRSATGLGAVDQATAIRDRWNANWADDLAAGKNPNDLYRVQMQALFAGIGDLTTLNEAAAALDTLDSVAAQFARTRAAEVRDATLQDLHLRQLQAQATIAQASGDAQAATAAQAAADDYQRQLAAQRELAAATDNTVRAQVEATQRMEEQAAVAKQQAAALAQAVQSGQSFLAWIDGKMGTASSAVSASDAYKAASDAYERDLGLARGNDADALSRLTQDADRLLTAYQGLNGSSGAAGFQNQILAQIAALPATQSYAATQGLQSVVDAITSLPHAAGGPASGLTLINEAAFGPELLRLPDGTEVITAKSSVEMMRRAMGGLGGFGGGASSGVDDIVLAIVTIGGRTIDALRQEFAALRAGQDELLGEFRLLRDGAGVQPWRR